MATSTLNKVVQQLRQAVLPREDIGMTDGRLLQCFIAHRDEAAFGTLVRRHGAMVMGVCRRLLRNSDDVDDAFQATFLVLVRKAGSIASRELLANWLYGVAYNTALKARAATLKRQTRERQVVDMSEPEAARQDLWHDLQPLLDNELSRLPEKYRVPIVLCDLEGKTRKEAARELGVPEGTVAGRLARARTILAKRLAGHGLVLSGGSLAVLLTENAASACVSTSMVSSTISAATLFATGQGAATGLISAKVAALTEGVLKTMLLTKLKIATVVLCAVAIIGGGAGVVTHRVLADQANDKPAKVAQKADHEGVLKIVDANKNSIVIAIASKDKQTGTKNVEEKTIAVAADARIVLVGHDKAPSKAVKLDELKQGMRVVVSLAPDKKTATSISAAEKVNLLEGSVKSVDKTNNTITIAYKDKESKQNQEQTLTVAAEAKVALGGHGKEGEKAAKLADLKEGMRAALHLSQDSKSVVSIRIPAPTAEGVIKSVDAVKYSITVTVGAKDKAQVYGYEVDKKAPITIEGKPGKLTDLKEGMPVQLLLSPEDSGVVGIRVTEKKGSE